MAGGNTHDVIYFLKNRDRKIEPNCCCVHKQRGKRLEKHH